MILKFQVSPWPEGVASYLTSDLDMERGVHNAWYSRSLLYGEDTENHSSIYFKNLDSDS